MGALELVGGFEPQSPPTKLHFQALPQPKDVTNTRKADDRFFLAGSLDSILRLWSIPDKAVAYWVQLSDVDCLLNIVIGYVLIESR